MTGKQESKYQELDVDNKLIMNLRDLGHTLRILFEGKGSQKRILILLYEAEGMTQRELTEKLGVQPGSASEVIGKILLKECHYELTPDIQPHNCHTLCQQ